MMKISAILLVAGAALLAFTAAEESSPNERQLSGRGKGKRGSSSSDSSSDSSDDGCADPAQAILDLFDCFEAEDIPCVVAGYGPGFETYHNENLAATDLQFTEEFWTLSLLVLDFDFDVKFYKNLGSNQATVRYVQTVTTTDGVSVGAPSSTEYPFSYARDQHEHVIATLNDDCQVEKWDQYGDNQEQNDVFDATNAVICVIGASGLPIEECDVTPPDEPEVAQ
ncbi:unnamed protein product [Ectocarpus sp. 8 AP-2014]